MGFRFSETINTVEDWYSIPTVSLSIIINILSHLIYDFLRKITSRRKTEVKRDWRRSRIRLLFDKTGRAAIHGYKETFFLVTPNLSPFLDSDLTVEQMLVNGKTHEEAHQACVERYRYWFETSTDPFVKRYLLWDGANKFLKILGYAKH